MKDIDGDEILLNIIKNSGEKSANKAIDKITDKESLVKLFQTKKPECSSEILDKAFKKIDDDSLLKIIVLECPFTLYNSSLSYTGIDRHEGEGVGLFSTVLSAEDYKDLAEAQGLSV